MYVYIWASVFFRQCLKKTLNQNYGKTFTSKIQEEKPWQRKVRSYIKWGTKQALSWCKIRRNMEMYPIFLPFQHTHTHNFYENEEPLLMELARITEEELKIPSLKSEAEYLQNFKA